MRSSAAISSVSLTVSCAPGGRRAGEAGWAARPALLPTRRAPQHHGRRACSPAPAPRPAAAAALLAPQPTPSLPPPSACLRVEQVVLLHKAHTQAGGVQRHAVGGDVPLQPDAAAVRHLPGQRPQQRGLAGAGGPHDGGEAPRRRAARHAVQQQALRPAMQMADRAQRSGARHGVKTPLAASPTAPAPPRPGAARTHPVFLSLSTHVTSRHSSRTSLLAPAPSTPALLAARRSLRRRLRPCRPCRRAHPIHAQSCRCVRRPGACTPATAGRRRRPRLTAAHLDGRCCKRQGDLVLRWQHNDRHSKHKIHDATKLVSMRTVIGGPEQSPGVLIELRLRHGNA